MLKPYMQLGWHTVPLHGELKRLEGGKKTLPKFETNWREKYTKVKNQVDTELGGVITGKVSNIVAIDCDNPAAFTVFQSLDPDYNFVLLSKGKGYTAGTFVYEYDEELPDNFKATDDTFKLDFYSNEGFIYLATEANATKVPLKTPLPAVKPLPIATKALLLQLAKKNAPKTEQQTVNNFVARCLAPLLTQFTVNRKFMPGLFKIITPKSFRTLPEYIEHGFLHPNNVPSGRGSEYLSQISAILGSDISVSEELYVVAMHEINSLWDEPLDEERLEATILDPMLQRKAGIDGVPFWKYDENWDQHRLVVSSKRQASIELAFDDTQNTYYAVDEANEKFWSFDHDAEITNFIGTVATSAPKKAEIKRSIPLVNVVTKPHNDFGFGESNDPTARELNTFVCSPALRIFRDPEMYAKFYKPPTVTLAYLENLVPDDEMRTFLLRFLRRKFTTFEYSPVSLYFLGTPGTGKDLFVKILEEILPVGVAKPTTKEFLEIYNSWMIGTQFVHLDEYGNQLSTSREREEALGKFKAYSGKEKIRIRKMRTDGFVYKHLVTFVSTANKNPFGIEPDDRRVALFHTPTPLKDTFPNPTEVHDQVLAEVNNFCYYLATEVPNMSKDQYMLPPATQAKHQLIAESMPAGRRLAYLLKHNMLTDLVDLAHDYDIPGVQEELNQGRLTTRPIEELYEVMTEYNGEKRHLNKAMRETGVPIKATTSEGERVYYYDLPKMVYFQDDSDVQEPSGGF